jgi:DNA-binding transcriptional regulator LsrR (DeoR family)
VSNVLKVSLQTTIYSLADRGWSQRRIASELGINRETVRRYLRLAKPAISIEVPESRMRISLFRVVERRSSLKRQLIGGRTD